MGSKARRHAASDENENCEEMMTEDLKRRILEIPGDEDGWFKGDERPLEVAEAMLAHGADEDTVVEWISAIY